MSDACMIVTRSFEGESSDTGPESTQWMADELGEEEKPVVGGYFGREADSIKCMVAASTCPRAAH